MPTVTAFIDALRVEFGREAIDQAIRQGLRDGTFWASEAGAQVGERPVDDDMAVRLDRMVPWSERR